MTYPLSELSSLSVGLGLELPWDHSLAVLVLRLGVMVFEHLSLISDFVRCGTESKITVNLQCHKSSDCGRKNVWHCLYFSSLNNFLMLCIRYYLWCCAFSLGLGIWSLGLGFETYIYCLFHFLLFILVFHLHVMYYLPVEPQSCW